VVGIDDVVADLELDVLELDLNDLEVLDSLFDGFGNWLQPPLVKRRPRATGRSRAAPVQVCK